MVAATAPYKAAVSECAGDFNVTPIANCGAGNGVVPDGWVSSAPRGQTASMAVASTGVITAKATAEMDSKEYILVPAHTPSTSVVTWSVSAGSNCIAAGLCKP